MPGEKREKMIRGHEESETARIAGAVTLVGGSEWGSSSAVAK